MEGVRRRDVIRAGGLCSIASLSGCVSAVRAVGDSIADARTCGSANSPTTPISTWHPEKDPANPVIEGTAKNFAQAYPPSVVRVDDRFYAVVKSWPDLVGFSSRDGVQWREEGSLLTPDDQTWTTGKLSNPLLRYDSVDETFHLYYTGVNAPGGTAIGHAMSTNPMETYTPSPAEPVYTSEEAVGDLDVSAQKVILSDVVRIDGRFVFYGTIRRNRRDDVLWVGSGQTWTEVAAEDALFDAASDEIDGTILQTPNVISIGNEYVMVYTAGWRGRDVLGERELYAAVGSSHDDISPTNEAVLTVGECGSWDERRVYAAQWLKVQDGQYLEPDRVGGSIRLYYSGHDLGTSKLTGNQGLTGLASFDSIPQFGG